MTDTNDELAQLLSQAVNKTNRMADLAFHSAKLLAWDPVTGQNTVQVLGSTLTDLPVLSASGTLALEPGATVGVLRTLTQYFIIGRISDPNTANYAAVRAAPSYHSGVTPGAFNQGQAANTTSGYVANGNTVTFTSYTGNWLVLLNAQIELSGLRAAARFSYSASGAQTVAASDARAAMTNDDGGGMGVLLTLTYSNTHEGGAPGVITVTPQFKLTSGPTAASAAIWTNRSVIVLSY